MGNIVSQHATNVVDAFVLRLARIVDSLSRTLNRKLSTLSSLFFSRVFGYDVVVFDDSPPSPTCPNPGQDLLCGPGNVCIVPASRFEHRQLEKKRRSERRKRAEAAAMGKEILRKHREEMKAEKRGYEKVESTPNSPIAEQWNEKGVRQSLGEVARAPPARPEWERETVGERERGKLWVMGNVQPSSKPQSGLTAEMVDPKTPLPLSLPTPRAEAGLVIQPRKSSKHKPKLANRAMQKIPAVVEKDETHIVGEVDGGHLTTKKEARELHAPTAVNLPPGALSLGPSSWEPAFRHPFAPNEEAIMLTSKAKQNSRQQQQFRPRLSLDTHLESSPLPNSTPAFIAPDETSYEPISRPPSSTSNRTPRNPALMPRKSIDAISLRSVDSHAGGGVIDVKTLANKAVKEEKGRRVWKDEVNKFAMQRCLQQQQNGDQCRRFSTATLIGGVTGADKALTRVRTQEGDATGRAGRRGSSPALAGMPVSGRSTPVLRAESPLHTVLR